jgi:hypothetical protein
MVSRYENTDVFVNKDRAYYTIMEDRGVTQIQQFGTRVLKYPSTEQISELNIIAHNWRYGDRYHKLSHDNYGDSKLWWVIAFFNQQPTESNLEFGSIVYIPHPLERILNIYGV